MGVLGPSSHGPHSGAAPHQGAPGYCRLLPVPVFFPEPGNPLTFRGVRGAEPCRQLAPCPWSCGKRQPGADPAPCRVLAGLGCAGSRDGSRAEVPGSHKTILYPDRPFCAPLGQVVGLWRVRGQRGLCSCSAPCVMSWFPRLVTSPLEGTMLVQIFGKAQEPLALPDAHTAPMGDSAGVFGCSWGHPV